MQPRATSSPRSRHAPIVAALALLSYLVASVVAQSSSSSLAPPFAHLPSTSASSRYGAQANFALAALILCVLVAPIGWFCVWWWRGLLAPTYGQRLKWNVVTGRPTMRDAPMRTLPTPEEAALAGQQGREPGQSVEATRFGMCVEICPPCLTRSGGCCDWLWCGPACCCGAATFSEWLFAFVYRSYPFRWLALLGYLLIVGLDVFALAMDVWSWDRHFQVPDGKGLHVGLLEVRAGDSTATYSCGEAESTDLVQCGTFRVSAGFEFGFVLSSGALSLVGFFHAFALLIRGRSLSSFSWLLAVSNTFALTSAVLLWPLSPHLVFENVYPDAILPSTQTVDLVPGPSWGVLIGAWVISVLAMVYVKGHVQCTSLMESGDKDAQATAAAKSTQPAAGRNPRTVQPADQLGSSQILVLQPEHLELEERRAQAAQWTKEGYGGDQVEGGFSPTEAYARALPYASGAFPLAARPALSSTMTQVQRPWHANESIPMAMELQPLPWQQAREQRMWQVDQQRRNLARTAPTASAFAQQRAEPALDGPFVSEPPRFLDAADPTTLRREDDIGYSFGVSEDQDLFEHFPSGTTGLGQRDAVRQAYGSPSSRLPPLPTTPYFTIHANSDRPVKVLRDESNLDATFERAEDQQGKPAEWGTGQQQQQQQPYQQLEQQQTSGSPVLQTPRQTRQMPRADRSAPTPAADTPDYSPRVTGPDMRQFQVLSAQYVQDALQLDEAELDMLSEKRKRSKQQQAAQEQQQQQGDYEQEEGNPEQNQQQQSADQPPPSYLSQPLTPAEYRAALRDDRERAPNLLTPAAETLARQYQQQEYQPQQQQQQQYQRPSRLPPLQSTLGRGASFGGGASRSFAPTYNFHAPPGSPSHLHSVRHHPFASELSPQRGGGGGLPSAVDRVYHYQDPSMTRNPSYHNYHHAAQGPPGGRSGLLSPSESERDLHFASTRSQFHQARPESFGASGTYGPGATSSARAGPSQLNHTYGSQSAFYFGPAPPLPGLDVPTAQTPRFTLNDHPLHIDTTSSSDPLGRTIPTPQPIPLPRMDQSQQPPVNISYDPYANEPSLTYHQLEDDLDIDDDAEDLRLQQDAPARRMPLAPQTPRIIDGPQSAMVLRGTPIQPPMQAYSAMPMTQQGGPYSRQFGYY